MKKMFFINLIILILSNTLLSNEEPRASNSWTGHILRASLGNAFSFEIDIKESTKYKGDGFPTNAMFLYGYQFESGLHLAAGLNWTILYPRNFQKLGNEAEIFGLPYAIWWVPLTNLQISWACNDNWLVGLGMVYLWGLSTNLRYKFSDHVFIENNNLIWLDRIFKTKGAVGEGFDNLMLSVGLGFLI